MSRYESMALALLEDAIIDMEQVQTAESVLSVLKTLPDFLDFLGLSGGDRLRAIVDSPELLRLIEPRDPEELPDRVKDVLASLGFTDLDDLEISGMRLPEGVTECDALEAIEAIEAIEAAEGVL